MLISLTAKKNKVELRIAGKDYKVVGSESVEYIHRVGLYVDRKMTDILKMNNKLSTSLAAVLTAINVVDDLFKSRESEHELKNQLKKVTEELERLKRENKALQQENTSLSDQNTELKLELAKREAELNEVRNSLDKAERVREQV
ncbi:MAG: cell division protein ZapA [Clostridiaceae bacterium]|jgi:cell division protein ZapA|nr:cell division protein ZapA [Clostridiaceae bacterium]